MKPTVWELRQLHDVEADALGRWLAGEPYEELYEDEELCSVCSGAGHRGGEWGELCPSGKPSGWFDPSDPRELEDSF